jgi:hypothetical protein
MAGTGLRRRCDERVRVDIATPRLFATEQIEFIRQAMVHARCALRGFIDELRPSMGRLHCTGCRFSDPRGGAAVGPHRRELPGSRSPQRARQHGEYSSAARARAWSSQQNAFFKEHQMSLGTVLLVVLVLLLIGALPNWSHSKSWGYAPSGGLGVVVLIIVVLLVLGRI